MKTKHTLFFGLFALFLALMSFKATAEDLLPPQQVIAEASGKLRDRMKDQNFLKDFNQVTEFVNSTIYPHTDFDKISALVLGKNWKAATPEEKERFKHEFQILLIRTYSRAFAEFKDWDVHFLPLDMQPNDTKALVKSEVLQAGAKPIGVDYRMELINGEWKAYDIMIEGVSLVTNYRSTFNNEIQTKGSLSAVIEGLVKRNAEALSSKNS